VITKKEKDFFSFDGENIKFYRHNDQGNLQAICESSKKSFKIGHGCYTKEHANVGDISFQTFFESLSNDAQNEIRENLQYYNLAEFRKTSSKDKRLFVDLKVGLRKIRAGMIVSFGGYYSIPDEPIAYDVAAPINSQISPKKLEKRFLATFETLVSETTNTAKMIAKQIGYEGNTIHGAIKQKALPSIVMGAVKNGKITWANHTSRSLGWRQHIPGGFFINQYVQAATMNFDHFGKEAELAYETGHRLALQTAKIASNLSGEEKWIKFSEALSLELFACHFFADLFVSGHVRTPRKKIFEIFNQGNSVKKKWMSTLFSNLMHDEDNEKSVYVCSKKHSNPWMAMGDYRHEGDSSSDEGERITHEAIADRLHELYQVFCGQAKWQDIIDNFKNDIPNETTTEWMDACKIQDTEVMSYAFEHSKRTPPLFKIEEPHNLMIRPEYKVVGKKQMILLLADILAKGIRNEIKEINPLVIKEIARISHITTPHEQVEKSISLSEYLSSTDDLLTRTIIEELYILDEADEVVIAIELEAQTPC